jgi:hypothetical protein
MLDLLTRRKIRLIRYRNLVQTVGDDENIFKANSRWRIGLSVLQKSALNQWLKHFDKKY